MADLDLDDLEALAKAAGSYEGLRRFLLEGDDIGAVAAYIAAVSPDVVLALIERLRAAAEASNNRLLAALWEIRMASERATVDEHPAALPNRIIGLALRAMGSDKRRAQEQAAKLRG